MKVDLSCPIELWEYELPTDSKPVCSFMFFNLEQRTISSVQITVTFFDKDDEVISRRVERPMALEAIGRSPFVVTVDSEGLPVEAVDLTIDKAWFEDGEDWRRQQDVRLADYEPNELPPNRKLEELRYIAGPDAVGFPSDQGAIWICVCGRVNAAEEAECRRCSREKEQVFADYSPMAVQEKIDAREAELEEKARRVREEASRREFMRQDAARRQKRVRRMRTFIITSVLIVGVLAYLFIVLGLPELKYQSAVSALAQGDLSTARGAFEELLDYRDSPDMIKECDLRLATEYALSGDMTKIDTAIDMLGALEDYPGAPEMAQEATYQKGTLYMDARSYADASAIFDGLGSFRDSQEQYSEAEYQLAKIDMEAKQYEEAERRFTALGPYLDAAALAKECVYRPALTLLSEGQYMEAADMFASITGYKDSDEQRLQSIYQDALRAQLGGDPEYAAERFALLGDYQDSPEQVKHSTYLAATAARDAGKYTMAIKLFSTFPDYLDSAQQVQECTYLPAKALMTDGQYAEAAEMFITIPGYEDADDLYSQCIYIPAGEAADAGNFEEALALYRTIPDYEDVGKLIPQTEYRQAEQLEDDGKYEEAAEAFAALEDYSDAADREKAARYAWAEEAFAEGDFVLASDRFEALGKYSNAQTRVKECAYELALQKIKNGEYADAYADLAAIENYDPAKEKAREAAYLWGEERVDAGDLEGAAEAFALAGRYQDADARRQESIYQRATNLKTEGEYQAAGELFNTITGYMDAKARRDESYDLWLAEQYEQAQTLYTDGKYAEVIALLKGLDMDALPKPYADLQTIFFDSNLKIARQLIAEDKALEAYGYLMAAEGYRNAGELLDKNIYRILGTWETDEGKRYAFYLNGTASIDGKTVYFNMFNPYGISTGDTNDPADMKRTLSYSSGSANTLQLREDATEKTFRLTRVKPPEVSPTNDAEGSAVLPDETLEHLDDPVVDVITIGGEVDATGGNSAGTDEDEDAPENDG